MKFEKYVNESSLSRIHTHIEKTELFGVISPIAIETIKNIMRMDKKKYDI